VFPPKTDCVDVVFDPCHNNPRLEKAQALQARPVNLPVTQKRLNFAFENKPWLSLDVTRRACADVDVLETVTRPLIVRKRSLEVERGRTRTCNLETENGPKETQAFA
jgi:hypothetical protein